MHMTAVFYNSGERESTMIKNVIFDCFGTLIDTGTGSLDAVRKILNSVGLVTDEKDFYKEWKRIKKEMTYSEEFHSEKELFLLSLAKMFEKYNVTADPKVEVQPMIKVLFGERRLFPDTMETLEYLKKSGINYAIGSTTDTDSLEHFLGMNHLVVPLVFTSEDMKVYKPLPEFYLTILQKTGWQIEETLFVGDSLFDDVEGPKSIKMRAALIDRNKKYKGDSKIKPDYIFNSLMDIKNIWPGEDILNHD